MPSRERGDQIVCRATDELPRRRGGGPDGELLRLPSRDEATAIAIVRKAVERPHGERERTGIVYSDGSALDCASVVQGRFLGNGDA